MHRFSAILLTLLILLNLSACSRTSDEPTDTTAATTIPTTAPTQPAVTETVPPETAPVETTIPAQPLHSEFYIEGISVIDVIVYFREVCLAAEFVTSGDPSRLQKWTSPIYFKLNGEYTQEDYDTLISFVYLLNTISGFPGIYETQDPLITNLSIHFCDQEGMVARLGENFRWMDGGVTFWYTEDMIHKATICYRTDLDQYLRNSVILEEIYNGLGPIQDTDLRSDSIIYAGYSIPQSLTAVDELLLRLLYHPQMICGMDAAQCAEVIRQLYY